MALPPCIPPHIYPPPPWPITLCPPVQDEIAASLRQELLTVREQWQKLQIRLQSSETEAQVCVHGSQEKNGNLDGANFVKRKNVASPLQAPTVSAPAVAAAILRSPSP